MATSSFNFSDFITQLDKMGFYDVALPFLLVFTIVFAVLQKVQIFGDKSKNFNAVIALVMAFLVVRSTAIVETMNLFLPKVSLISVVIICALLLVGLLLGKTSSGFTGILGGLGMILALVALGWSFFGSSDALGFELPSWLDMSSADTNFWIGMIVIVLLMWFITSDSSDKDNSFGKKVGQFLKELPGDFGSK